MALNSDIIETLPAVAAELNYLVPTSRRPRTYTFAAPNDEPQTTAVNEAHRVLIHDARPVATSVSLDEEGSVLIQHSSATQNFYDDDGEIKRVYYPEAERVLKDVTGADRVFIFDHTVRRDGRARFAPHSAFQDPNTPADSPPRESIELRSFVFHSA